MLACPVEVRISACGVAERAGRQTRQLSGVPIGEGDGYSVRSERAQAVYRICGKTRLALLAVCDHGRSSSFEALYRVADALVQHDVVLRHRDPACREIARGLDEPRWSGNASNRLGRNRHALISHRFIRYHRRKLASRRASFTVRLAASESR